MSTHHIKVRDENWTLVCWHNPPDSVLATAYITLHQQGVLETFFQQGVPSVRGFLEMMDPAKRDTIACFLSRDETTQPVFAGFSAITTQDVGGEFRKAEVSMAYLKEYQTPPLTLAMSGAMIDATFEADKDLAVMYGTIPVGNRPAILHAIRLGFKVSSPIDHYTLWMGKPSGVVITSLTRKAWSRNGSIKRGKRSVEGDSRKGTGDLERVS